MMQLRYNVATSLDGFIAPADESTGWIVEDPTIDFEALYASFDAFIMGRKTYEIITGSGANPFHGRPKESVVVISRSLNEADNSDITILRDGFLDYIRDMKRREGRGWLMGGGWLATACLEAGLLDAVDAAVMPRLMGAGFKLITNSRSVSQKSNSFYKLALANLQKLDSGIIITQYDIVYDLDAQVESIPDH